MSTPAQPGMSLSDAGKQYSQASSTALKKLNSIDRKFEGITDRIADIEHIPISDDGSSPDNMTRLLKAKNELAQIVGDLERLQCKELDSIETAELNSGKSEAKNKRKSLNVAVENLMRRTCNLHNEFVSTVEKLKSGKLEDDIGYIRVGSIPIPLDENILIPNPARGSGKSADWGNNNGQLEEEGNGDDKDKDKNSTQKKPRRRRYKKYYGQRNRPLARVDEHVVVE